QGLCRLRLLGAGRSLGALVTLVSRLPFRPLLSFGSLRSLRSLHSLRSLGPLLALGPVWPGIPGGASRELPVQHLEHLDGREVLDLLPVWGPEHLLYVHHLRQL